MSFLTFLSFTTFYSSLNKWAVDRLIEWMSYIFFGQIMGIRGPA